ncbi:MAG TPA: hypothetical protein VMX79_02575 [bacterium]|nr:hypothetical protein [bacterium]
MVNLGYNPTGAPFAAAAVSFFRAKYKPGPMAFGVPFCGCSLDEPILNW